MCTYVSLVIDRNVLICHLTFVCVCLRQKEGLGIGRGNLFVIQAFANDVGQPRQLHMQKIHMMGPSESLGPATRQYVIK